MPVIASILIRSPIIIMPTSRGCYRGVPRASASTSTRKRSRAFRPRFIDKAGRDLTFYLRGSCTCRYWRRVMFVTCAENSASPVGGGSSSELRWGRGSCQSAGPQIRRRRGPPSREGMLQRGVGAGLPAAGVRAVHRPFRNESGECPAFGRM